MTLRSSWSRWRRRPGRLELEPRLPSRLHSARSGSAWLRSIEGTGSANLESPARDLTVVSVLRGLGRLADERPRQVKALREHEIAAILSCCDRLAGQRKRHAIATRDAAVIAVGFAGALRRSEICGLQLEDVELLERT